MEKRNDRPNQQYLRCTTTQNTPDPLYRMQYLFGGRVFQDARGMWRHRIERAHARRMLVALLPFLTVKRRKAEEVIALVPDAEAS